MRKILISAAVAALSATTVSAQTGTTFNFISQGGFTGFGQDFSNNCQSGAVNTGMAGGVGTAACQNGYDFNIEFQQGFQATGPIQAGNGQFGEYQTATSTGFAGQWGQPGSDDFVTAGSGSNTIEQGISVNGWQGQSENGTFGQNLSISGNVWGSTSTTFTNQMPQMPCMMNCGNGGGGNGGGD